MQLALAAEAEGQAALDEQLQRLAEKEAAAGAARVEVQQMAAQSEQARLDAQRMEEDTARRRDVVNAKVPDRCPHHLAVGDQDRSTSLRKHQASRSGQCSGQRCPAQHVRRLQGAQQKAVAVRNFGQWAQAWAC